MKNKNMDYDFEISVTTKAGCLTLIQQIKEYQVLEETFSPTSAFKCSTDSGAPQPASCLGSNLTINFVYPGWGSTCQVFFGDIIPVCL